MALISAPDPGPDLHTSGLATCVVIPCYNEAERLDRSALLALAGQPDLRLLFVDDGSTDATGALLDELSTRSPSISVVHLASNRGKGEAVRLGLLAALEPSGTCPPADLVAYYDADLATPPDELLRLVAHLRHDGRLVWVAGVRYGHDAEVRRRPDRRLLGECFSFLARRALGIDIRDTQCGAKVLRDGPALRGALRRPFTGRWSFDIEILDRLLSGGTGVTPVPATSIAEVALTGWHDISGSKLGAGEMAVALAQVLRLGTRRGWRSRSVAPVACGPIDLTDSWDNPPVALYTSEAGNPIVSVQRS